MIMIINRTKMNFLVLILYNVTVKLCVVTIPDHSPLSEAQRRLFSDSEWTISDFMTR